MIPSGFRFPPAVHRLTFIAGLLVSFSAMADDYSEVTDLLRAGKHGEAITRADRFLAQKPKDPQMRFVKGLAQTESGRTSDAIGTFSKLTEDYPGMPEPYNNLAVLYAAQGQFEKARSTLEAALRTNPSYATAYENLGDVYAKLASQAYSSALQLDSSNSSAKPKLALIRDVFATNATPGKTLPVQVAQGRTATGSVSPAPAPAPTAAPAPAPAPATAPMAAPPAAAPASAARAPAPAARPPAPSAPANAEREVQAAVTDWAAAWSSKDMSGYFAAYAKEFTPPGGVSRSVWEAERQQRITGKSHISVKIDQLQVKVTGHSAVARFRQAYKADTLSVSSRKTLDLVKSGDRWLIVKESTGG